MERGAETSLVFLIVLLPALVSLSGESCHIFVVVVVVVVVVFLVVVFLVVVSLLLALVSLSVEFLSGVNLLSFKTFTSH